MPFDRSASPFKSWSLSPHKKSPPPSNLSYSISSGAPSPTNLFPPSSKKKPISILPPRPTSDETCSSCSNPVTFLPLSPETTAGCGSCTRPHCPKCISNFATCGQCGEIARCDRCLSMVVGGGDLIICGGVGCDRINCVRCESSLQRHFGIDAGCAKCKVTRLCYCCKEISDICESCSEVMNIG